MEHSIQLHFDPFPILTTERLILRQTDESDIPELFFLRSDEQTMKYINRKRAETLEDAAALVKLFAEIREKGDGLHWTITMKGNTKMIGNIGFFRTNKEHHRSEVGYILHPDYHGQGIMHEALAAVLDFGFHSMKLHTIEAQINPANTASAKLLERSGFTREGYFKENFYWEGKYLDSAVYSLITQKR